MSGQSLIGIESEAPRNENVPEDILVPAKLAAFKLTSARSGPRFDRALAFIADAMLYERNRCARLVEIYADAAPTVARKAAANGASDPTADAAFVSLIEFLLRPLATDMRSGITTSADPQLFDS